MAAAASKPDMPVALSAITAGLGILGVVLVLFRIISPPDFGVGDLVDVGRGIGVFLGLVAVAGVAYGGWAAMQAEGSSFGAQTDRVGGDRAPATATSVLSLGVVRAESSSRDGRLRAAVAVDGPRGAPRPCCDRLNRR